MKDKVCVLCVCAFFQENNKKTKQDKNQTNEAVNVPLSMCVCVLSNDQENVIHNLFVYQASLTLSLFTPSLMTVVIDIHSVCIF